MSVWLDGGDTGMSPRSFLTVVIASGILAGSAVGAYSGVPGLGVIAGMGATLTPVTIVDRRRVAAVRRRRQAWPDALRDLATQLRSGSSMHAALVELGRLGPPPLRPALQRYERLSVALDHRAALETIRNELADALSDRIVEVILISFEQGTRVVIDVLGDLAESAVQDIRLAADIETAQLETKLEARGAAVLPFVVLGLLCLGSEGYRTFYAGASGTVVMVIGALMSSVGLAVIGRLGRVPTEPRTIVAAIR